MAAGGLRALTGIADGGRFVTYGTAGGFANPERGSTACRGVTSDRPDPGRTDGPPDGTRTAEPGTGTGCRRPVASGHRRHVLARSGRRRASRTGRAYNGGINTVDADYRETVRI